MPGLAGFTIGDATAPDAARRTLVAMQELLTTGLSVKEEPVVDDRLACSRAHTGLLQPQPQPAREEDLAVWLDGELYNAEELARRSGIATGSDVSDLTDARL